MAIKTSALVPFPVTSIPDRATPLWIADKTLTTASTGSTVAAKRLNRVQSATFGMGTDVTEVSEMGSLARVGGVDALGESTWKVELQAVGINNIASLCGIPVATTSGATTSLGLTEFQNAQIDFFRMVADPQEDIFGTLYLQDCIIDDYTVDVKEKGTITESLQGRGPNATFFPGFFVPKTYVVKAADVTAGYIDLTSVFGADEAPVEIYLPAAGTPPSYWQDNGAQYFLKIEKVPGASLAAAPVRYYEALPTSASVATYDHTLKHLTLSDPLVAGDLIRLVFVSYNTDTFPTAVPFNTPDTTDRAAIADRLVPISIAAGQFKRVQSVSFKFSLKRDHVNGVGEKSIVYGVSQIPDVTISLDVKESDTSLLNQLQNASISNTSNGGTIKNDFLDLNYITRSQLDPANAISLVAAAYDPWAVNTVLATYSCAQMVVKKIDYASSNKADNTIKVDAEDIRGVLTVSYTHP